ncbi:MAG: peptide chain release factor N(5)-glutamine methyltransferase, partial [Acidimicrobiia bacterium]|nr:peptide chain release factor N(5)-glutamine methyltransferase [Acidimicrobiia bacterium]
MSRANVVLGVDVDEDRRQRFDGLVAARAAGAPLQYLEGSVPFGGVEIAVDDRVLIPRPETEFLFDTLARRCDPSTIVDLCTGSGNLAIALANRFPDAAVYATDVAPDAVAVARQNAERNGVDVSIVAGDLFEPLPVGIRRSVDLLVANPPYLASHEFEGLPTDVKHEPYGALVAGPVGDEVIHRIADGIGTWLADGAVIALEVSEFHVHDVAPLFEA